MNSPTAADTAERPLAPHPGVSPPNPFSALVGVEFGAATHPGLVRENNEDCYLAGRIDRALHVFATNLPADDVPAEFGEAAYGMLVADGLGGRAAGEVASRTAIGTMLNLVLHTPAWIMRVGEKEADQIVDRITARFQRAGLVLARMAEDDPSLAGMGTTLTTASSVGEELFIGHVGDTRAYLLRGPDLIRLTRDDTYAQELADQGFIRPDQVAGHRLKHVLTRALGRHGANVRVDVRRVGLQHADQVLLCSDGLTDMVADDGIRAKLAAAGTAQAAADALVAAALDAGGKDNVTAVVARYTFPAGY
ncbi:MAG: protein phosphatase 2C domain-containing protein [Gemmataceae bacterium]|nr:protein phosphatase 2C domain-containing protein [Gemmataceae bacterium]